jgi:hypothetical protein
MGVMLAPSGPTWGVRDNDVLAGVEIDLAAAGHRAVPVFMNTETADPGCGVA